MGEAAEEVIRAYKFLLRPTSRQEQALTEMLRDHCALYNAALQERRDAYRHVSKTRVRYGDQSAQLKHIRAEVIEQARWSFSSQQATLRRLDKAFQAFLRRVKAGQAPGYPRFRGVGRFDTVEFPKDGDGCRWDSSPEGPQTRVRLQGVGHVRVHQHRAVKGLVKTVSVKREGRRWYVVVVCDQVPAEPLPVTGSIVGIDVGVVHFYTDSSGHHEPNPRPGNAAEAALMEAHRYLSTFPRRSRSKRRRAAARKVAKLHRKVQRQRLDFHHKAALALVRGHDVIAHESLNIAGMTKVPKPKADESGGFLPNGAAAKGGLNKSILDAAWSQFLSILANKAERAGRQVVPVNAANTSRTCPECGHCSKDNRLTQADFRCASCGYAANADYVGALNILNRAGLALCDVA
ncbi:RNA-guided endonuclease InsQ/TnpB family protein [Kribbella sp. GL6]|uniref:RNA-guided endonuclease InsQ/TnpB family protein n=1 Tax=Kribbella sp. GL6 TaxID=3419765 RepID=UPI003D0121BC